MIVMIIIEIFSISLILICKEYVLFPSFILVDLSLSNMARMSQKENILSSTGVLCSDYHKVVCYMLWWSQSWKFFCVVVTVKIRFHPFCRVFLHMKRGVVNLFCNSPKCSIETSSQSLVI